MSVSGIHINKLLGLASRVAPLRNEEPKEDICDDPRYVPKNYSLKLGDIDEATLKLANLSEGEKNEIRALRDAMKEQGITELHANTLKTMAGFDGQVNNENGEIFSVQSDFKAMQGSHPMLFGHITVRENAKWIQYVQAFSGLYQAGASIGLSPQDRASIPLYKCNPNLE